MLCAKISATNVLHFCITIPCRLGCVKALSVLPTCPWMRKLMHYKVVSCSEVLQWSVLKHTLSFKVAIHRPNLQTDRHRQTGSVGSISYSCSAIEASVRGWSLLVHQSWKSYCPSSKSQIGTQRTWWWPGYWLPSAYRNLESNKHTLLRILCTLLKSLLLHYGQIQYRLHSLRGITRQINWLTELT